MIEDDDYIIEKTGPDTLRITVKKTMMIMEMSYETYLRLVAE